MSIPASSNWDTAYSSVTSNSGTWFLGDTAYTLISANSAAWLTGGSGGSGGQIAPFAFTTLTNAATGSGINLTWDYTYVANTTSEYVVTFDDPQSNTNYTVVTDAQGDDVIRLVVSNKTVSSFKVDVRSLVGMPTQDLIGGTVMVYDENPSTGGTGAGSTGPSVDLTSLSSNWESTYTTTSANSADWNLGAVSWTTITANSASWLGSNNGGNTGGSGVGAAGAFLTNITCGTNTNRTNGITQLTDMSNEVAVDGDVPVLSAVVDTPTVRIHTQWEGNSTQWTGSPYISSFPVSGNTITGIGGSHARRFEGYVDLDLSAYTGQTVSVPYSYTGLNNSVNIQVAGAGPAITNLQITSSPQHGQDHYKTGDTITFVVEFDTTDVTSVSLQGGNAHVTSTVTDQSVTMNGVSATVSTTVQNGNVTPTDATFNITAKNSLGTQGAAFVSSETASVMNSPRIVNMTFGTYPTTFGVTQTEVKNGDVVPCTMQFDTTNVNQVTFDGTSSHVNGNNTINSVSMNGVSATVDMTVAGTTVSDNNSPGGSLLSARAKARHTGTHEQSGPLHTSTEQVRVNNQTPTLGNTTITYPANQQALKDSETATVNLTVNNQGQNPVYEYTSPNSQLTITSDATYAANKTVTRVGGDYNISTNNYKLLVKRVENGTSGSKNTVVFIAHVAPTISITSNNGTRMRSGGNDNTSQQNYNIVMSSNQILIQAPTLAASNGGTLGTFNFNANSTSLSASMTVHDNDAKGTHSYSSLNAVGLARRAQTSISSGGSYILGGFVSRVLSMNPFGETVSANVLWSTYNKLTLSWSKYPSTTYESKPAGTTGNFADPNKIFWSVTDQTSSNTGTTPITFKILDNSKTSTSTSSTSVTVEETV